MSSVVLDVRNLTTSFNLKNRTARAVDNISYSLASGDALAIVGESGSGKSVSVLSMMRLLNEPPAKIEKGEVFLNGTDLLKLSKEELRRKRGSEISMIFQDPLTSLNPVLSLKKLMSEAIRAHYSISRKQAVSRSIDLLKLVGISDAKNRINNYPFQFSGGMRQRAMIAIALSCEPDLLIADEPTTALDVTIQDQVVRLVDDLKKELGMSVIWITHDLGVVSGFADHIIVMYGGTIVEKGPIDLIYNNPKHPYTSGLIKSVPRIDQSAHEPLHYIQGSPPDLAELSAGCPFALRCERCMETCTSQKPEMQSDGERQIACWNPL